MKLIRAALATALFLSVLIPTYYLHANFFKVDVVFYAAIADAVMAALATGVLLYVLKGFRVFNHFERLLLVVIWLLSGYAMAISVPTVIDRSLSFYILEKLQQRGGGIQQARFAQVFTDEYLKEHRLVDVRLTEQLASGTIAIENGCVRLTAKGESLASFSRYFRAHWLPKERLLLGTYSDALVDPFRNSGAQPDYACQ